MAYQEITTLPPLYISITDSSKGVDDYSRELKASADFSHVRWIVPDWIIKKEMVEYITIL